MERRVLVSGHGPLLPDGMPAGPFGRVPDQVPLEVAQESARLAALAVIGTVRRAVGGLDRIAAWLTVSGFVFAEPGERHTTAVLNAFSAVVHDAFGRQVGAPARTAIGAATLPSASRWSSRRTCSSATDPAGPGAAAAEPERRGADLPAGHLEVVQSAAAPALPSAGEIMPVEFPEPTTSPSTTTAVQAAVTEASTYAFGTGFSVTGQ